MNRIESCNFEAGAAPVAQPEPAGEGVVIVGWQFKDDSGVWRTGSEMHNHRQNTEEAGIEVREIMTVTQHQRLLEEAKQGQRVLAMELEQLKAEVKRARCEQEVSNINAEHWSNNLARSGQRITKLREERDQLKADNEVYKSCNDELKAEVAHFKALLHLTRGERNEAQRENEALRAKLAEKEESLKLQTMKAVMRGEQLAAQTVVLPERRSLDTQRGDLLYRAALVWNACLSEVERLNGAKP
jgi:chromosome segregation ATPase